MRPYPNIDAGYSPDISMELELHGQTYRVASLAPDFVALRDARPAPAGEAVVRLHINEKTIVYRMMLPKGIDPAVDHQVVESTQMLWPELAVQQSS